MENSGNDNPEDGNKTPETSSDVDDNVNRPSSSSFATFQKLKKHFKRRSYRRKARGGDDDAGSSNMQHNSQASGSSSGVRKLKKLRKGTENVDEETRADSKPDESDTESEGNVVVRDENNSEEWSTAEEEDYGVPLMLKKVKPKYSFFLVKEMMHRQIGQCQNFQTSYYGSIQTVERLQLLHCMKEHQGCVNTVEFNENGDLLVSGSDDLAVCVWNWSTGKKRNSYESGHRSNIFQASWLPRNDLTMMVTCASDGQVRLLDLVQGTTRMLASHQGACNKFAIHPETPHVAISVGDDGKVLSIDVRDDETTKLTTMKERAFTIQLYTIHSNPQNSHEFCVGGHSESVKIFDRRKASAPLYKLCPTKLVGNDRVHITGVTYNYNGTEILASYNDDDIYLFDTLIPHPNGDYAHKYVGHRNSRTIKGVNYFGPKSEFIVSGSDCGSIFFWEKNSEALVQCVIGDFQGVVNCVKPHPTFPVLASSGIDDDVKIWTPSCDEPPSMMDLRKRVSSNMKDRAEGRPQCQNRYDGNLFCIILEHFCQNRELFNFLPGRRSSGFDEDNDADDDDDDD